MSVIKTPLPEIVSRDEWLAANGKQIKKEKAHTRARDALNAERRRLPAYHGASRTQKPTDSHDLCEPALPLRCLIFRKFTQSTRALIKVNSHV